MKVLAFILSIAIGISGISLGVYYNQMAQQAVKELDEERYLKLIAEEGLENAKMKISSLEADVSKMENKIRANSRLLEQTSAFNEDLKLRLKKASMMQEDLEKRLKELGQI